MAPEDLRGGRRRMGKERGVCGRAISMSMSCFTCQTCGFSFAKSEPMSLNMSLTCHLHCLLRTSWACLLHMFLTGPFTCRFICHFT